MRVGALRLPARPYPQLRHSVQATSQALLDPTLPGRGFLRGIAILCFFFIFTVYLYESSFNCNIFKSLQRITDKSLKYRRNFYALPGTSEIYP